MEMKKTMMKKWRFFEIRAGTNHATLSAYVSPASVSERSASSRQTDTATMVPPRPITPSQLRLDPGSTAWCTFSYRRFESSDAMWESRNNTIYTGMAKYLEHTRGRQKLHDGKWSVTKRMEFEKIWNICYLDTETAIDENGLEKASGMTLSSSITDP